MKLFGSVGNRLLEGKTMEGTKIEIGVGVTEMCYTDRHPYTIVRIINDKKIVIRQDNAVRIDNNGMSESQTYQYTTQEKKNYTDSDKARLNEKQLKKIKRYDLGSNEKLLHKTPKNGWKEVNNVNGFTIGTREEYYDFSF